MTTTIERSKRWTKGQSMRIVKSDAGNEGKIVTLVARMSDTQWFVRGYELRAVRESDGAVRIRNWGLFTIDQLEIPE